jgi:uridine kinase
MEINLTINKIENLIKKKLKKYKKKNVLIFVEGIAGVGKTSFANYLKKKIRIKKKIYLVSKDIFLKSREQRINITNKMKNKKYRNQNQIHYNQDKIKKFIDIICDNIKINNKFKYLYDRKSGKNKLEINFRFSNNSIIIIEGLYISEDFKSKNIDPIKILLETDVYKSISEKIRRIRDKKISIYNVIKEYINIHLISFVEYLQKKKFDLFIVYRNKKFYISKKSKKKQIIEIYKFISQHK